MKGSIKMEDYDGFPWKSHKIQRTRILPLRWISNWLNGVATYHLLKAVYLDEDGNWGWRYKYHAKMWKYLSKPYERYGTYYELLPKPFKKTEVNWDEPINQKILQDCHRCGEFIVTDQKDELSLFMYDHYGKEGIRKCTVPDDDETIYPTAFMGDE